MTFQIVSANHDVAFLFSKGSRTKAIVLFQVPKDPIN